MGVSRLALKALREFMRREAAEKPGQLTARKLKLTTLMRLGRVPEFRLRVRGKVVYLVESRRGRETRMYFFDGRGCLLGAQNYELGDPDLRWLLDNSRRLF
jgi:hypothetical protein